MATSLTIVPNLGNKGGTTDNRVAVGEKVVVTAKGLGQYWQKLRLRIRFMDTDVAVFPAADGDAWTQTGDDDADAQCVIDLNTVELRHAMRFMGDLGLLPCLAMLDTGIDTTVQNLFCAAPVKVGNWLPLTGLPDPIALTDWKTRCDEIEAALLGHKGSTANPHNVTAAQVGSPTNAAFSTHTGNAVMHITAAERARWNEGGGDENVIETVKVNGTALVPDAQKAVDVPVPGSPGSLSGSWDMTGLSDLNLPAETYANGERVIREGDVVAPDSEETDEAAVAGAKATGEALDEIREAVDAKADAGDIPTALSQLTGDATHRTVTDAEKAAWNGKQDAESSVSIPEGESLVLGGTDFSQIMTPFGTLQSALDAKAGVYAAIYTNVETIPPFSAITLITVSAPSATVSIGLPAVAAMQSLTVDAILVVASGASVSSITVTVGGAAKTVTWLGSPTWTAGKSNGLAIRAIVDNLGGTTVIANKYGEW